MRDLSKWTEPQKEVITHSYGNLLVSASAGSGKTSVLVERIVNLILSGSANINSMLVVTFTNSASQEMRERLQAEIEKADDEKLLAQLDDLSTSDILTFDAFCIKIVREFGWQIGQNNNFAVADNSLSGFLKNQALDNIFAKHNKAFDEKFAIFADKFFDARNETKLRGTIASLHSFLTSKSAEDISYKQKLEQTHTLCSDNDVLKFLNLHVLATRDRYAQIFGNLLLQSKMLQEEKLEQFLEGATQTLQMFGADFFDNISVFECIEQLKSASANRGDSAEVKDLKKMCQNALAGLKSELESAFSAQICSLGKQKMQADIESLKRDLQYLFDLVDEFDKEYGALKKRHQVLDFCDIEQSAFKILQNKEIATSVQNKYDWICVDEYQDTSALQESILMQITTGDNLFMVGDFKQSIYRFRQAEPKIFINKYNQYKNMQTSGRVLELKTNFRSDNAILQFDNFVFDHIYKRELDDFEYAGNADLEAGSTSQNSSDEPKIKILILDKSKNAKEDDLAQGDVAQDDANSNAVNVEQKQVEVCGDNVLQDKKTAQVYSVKDSELEFDELNSIQIQAILLAKEIKDMLGKKYFDGKSNSFKSITFKDIAVLCRKKSGVILEVGEILTKFGIPVTTTFNDGIFKSFDMEILMAFLQTINNHKDDVALASSLSNFGGITFDELAEIRACYGNKKYFYESVNLYKAEKNDILKDKICKFFEKIENYKLLSNSCDICELVLNIVSKEKLSTYFSVNGFGDEFESHLSLLLASIQSIKGYSLTEFVDYIKNFAGAISFENTIKHGDNSVTISTIHKSKGLEYPVVFLIDCGADFNQKSQNSAVLMDNDWGVTMACVDGEGHTKYQNILQTAFKLKIAEEEKKEEKRLLYVALTRAKNFLTIIGDADVGKLKSQQSLGEIAGAKNYLSWILGCFDNSQLQRLKDDGSFVNVLDDGHSKVVVQAVQAQEYQNVNQQPAQQINFPKAQESFRQILCKTFQKNNLAKKNSVTQILSEQEHYNISNFNYLKDDKTGDDDFLAVGTAYHKYMQLTNFCDDQQNIKNQVQNLIELRNISDEEARAVDVDKICTAITTINKLICSDDVVLKEQQFLAYLPANEIVDTQYQNKILVQGVADLIIIKNDQIYLIDYKTSRMKNERDFVSKYKTQLDIYATAIENFYQKRVTKKMIYSFYLDKLITI